MLKRAWHSRGRDLSRGPASRFVRDSTAREPITSEEERRGAPLFPPFPRRFFTTDKIPRRETCATRRRLILHGNARKCSGDDYTVRGFRRATQRGDDKLLGIIAVMRRRVDHSISPLFHLAWNFALYQYISASDLYPGPLTR